MDAKAAALFKAQAEEAIARLNLALLTAEQGASPNDYQALRRSIGDIIAKIDTLLRSAVFVAHPDMDDLDSRSEDPGEK